jgi:hypothetical protein
VCSSDLAFVESRKANEARTASKEELSSNLDMIDKLAGIVQKASLGSLEQQRLLAKKMMESPPTG